MCNLSYVWYVGDDGHHFLGYLEGALESSEGILAALNDNFCFEFSKEDYMAYIDTELLYCYVVERETGRHVVRIFGELPPDLGTPCIIAAAHLDGRGI